MHRNRQMEKLKIQNLSLLISETAPYNLRIDVFCSGKPVFPGSCSIQEMVSCTFMIWFDS